MVASDALQAISEMLRSRNFSVVVKEFREKSIYGNETTGYLVHAVLEKPGVIFTAKKYSGADAYRVRVVLTNATRELCDEVEELGYTVSEEDDRVVVVGHFPETAIIAKVAALFNKIFEQKY